MKLDTDEVVRISDVIRVKIADGNDHQSLLHLDAVEIAGHIRAIISFNPMTQGELCYYFRRRGFGNTLMIEYMLNRFCRRSTNNYLWDRDEFGRFFPARNN